MEIQEVLGLKIEQIAWMKAYFQEHMLDFNPPKEWKEQKMRECFAKKELINDYNEAIEDSNEYGT